MKNKWIYFYSGFVKVKITGVGTERLINQLTRKDFIIWNVKRVGSDALTFYIQLKDVHKLRITARKSECKIVFLQRTGFPFLFKRLLKNNGFLIGFITFFITIFILSNMVWGIEIKGANPETEHKIRKELDKMGLQIGQMQFFVHNVDTIQKKLTDKIEAITWVGIELKGTKYYMQVVEKDQPKSSEYINPQHLVAKKKAVITNMFVESGEPIVSVNDHVQKGQLLVSGMIGKEGQWVSVPAKGVIYGETWYKSDVELPIKTIFAVFNGKEMLKYHLEIGGWDLPVWGFGKVVFSNYEVSEYVKRLKFLKWELPITFKISTYREKEQVTRIYSNEEAIEMAKEIARKDIKGKLDEEAKIKGEKVLHQQVENGKVKLSIHFQIIENIATGQPIIQGD